MKAQGHGGFLEYDGAEAGLLCLLKNQLKRESAIVCSYRKQSCTPRFSNWHRGGQGPIGDAGKATLEGILHAPVEADAHRRRRLR